MAHESLRTVWIINHYATHLAKDGLAGRHHELSKNLVQSGWQPIVFEASTRHPEGRQSVHGCRQRMIGSEQGVQHVVLRAPQYAGSGVRRVINMAAFSIQLILPWNVRRLPRHNIVVGSTVHLFAAWAAERLAARYRVPFVYEIRDVWPDALVHLGRVQPNSFTARLIRAVSNHLIRKACVVISPLPEVAQAVIEAGFADKKFVWISNGVDPDLIQDNASQRGTDSDSFTVMYLGSLGYAMDLETLMEGFDRFTQENPEVDARFRIIGDGPRLDTLRQFAGSLSENSAISFEGRVPRAEVYGLASEADVLVHALHDHETYRFGISPNKLYDYLLAGRPVVFACNAPNNPVREADAGWVVEAESAVAVAQALTDAYRVGAVKRDRIGQRGRDFVRRHYTYPELARRFEAVLEEAARVEVPDV